MAYRLVDFSGDVAVEGTGPDATSALVDLGRALAHVLTDGSPCEPREERTVEVEAADEAGVAIAFLNELIYLFDAEGFLLAQGEGTVDREGGRIRFRGTLRGDVYDRARHGAGRGVKAATLHDARAEKQGGQFRFYAVLDL